MRISMVMPVYNGAPYIEAALQSLFAQRGEGLEVELIVMDGGSTDGTLEILQHHRDRLAVLVSERDRGPASALNKGLTRATGEILGWLNADDLLHPGALARAADTLARHPDRALCFGRCRIVDEQAREIRRFITGFKEMFFPISSRFTIQCINYISQPAMFFRRTAWQQAGPLREDLKAAFDYDFILRLWHHGGAVRVPGAVPLADFRWHAASISGSTFVRQFREEWEAAARDAGRFSPQALVHLGVRYGIVGSYLAMAALRRTQGRNPTPAR